MKNIPIRSVLKKEFILSPHFEFYLRGFDIGFTQRLKNFKKKPSGATNNGV